jgi:5-methylcytosine-specific restriction endonuclease McrA
VEQTLVLNATYEPIKIVDWRRAIVLWCQGKVEIVAEHDREVRAVTFTFKLPSVVRLLKFVRVRVARESVPFTRANIYRRDDYECQYCGETFESEDLTFDHVMPAAQGGRRDWTNIVKPA